MLEPDVQDQTTAVIVAPAGLKKLMRLSRTTLDIQKLADAERPAPLLSQHRGASVLQKSLDRYDTKPTDDNRLPKYHQPTATFFKQLIQTETCKTKTEYDKGDIASTQKEPRSDENNDYINSQQFFSGHATTLVANLNLRINKTDSYWNQRVSDRPGRCL